MSRFNHNKLLINFMPIIFEKLEETFQSIMDSITDRDLIEEGADIGRRIKVYWNLHKNVYSAQSREEKDEKVGWYVDKDFYSKEIFMRDVEFKVSEKGRQRVIKDKRKNVHSRLDGIRISEQELLGGVDGYRKISLYYNPYKVKTFVNMDNHDEKVLRADFVHLETVMTGGGERGKMTAYIKDVVNED